MSGFGTPKYGATGSFHKNFRLQTDKAGGTTSNIYRVLPPMHSLAESGRWALYLKQHFGYRGRNKQDPTKTRMMTFECLEDIDMRTKIVRSDCPECELIKRKKQQRDNRKQQAEAAGHSDEEIKTILLPFNKWLKDHNVDRKWHLAVMNENNEFGILQISHKCKKQLDARIDELRQMGIDPLAIDGGVWFNFKRTGRELEVTDTVEVVEVAYKRDDGRIVKEMKMAPLTEAQCKQALSTIPDLTTVIRKLSREQVNMLVNCSGDPDEVDAIFGAATSAERSPAVSAGRSVNTVTAGTQAPAKVLVTMPEASPEMSPDVADEPTAPVTPAPVTSTSDDDEIARLQAAIEARKAEIMAKKAEETKKPEPEPAQILSTAQLDEMDDDAFLAQFGDVSAT